MRWLDKLAPSLAECLLLLFLGSGLDLVFKGDSLLQADSYPESTGIVPLYLEPPRAPNNHVTVTTWALKHLFAITDSDYIPLWIPWCFH